MDILRQQLAQLSVSDLLELMQATVAEMQSRIFIPSTAPLWNLKILPLSAIRIWRLLLDSHCYISNTGAIIRDIYMAFQENRIVAFRAVHNGHLIGTFSTRVHRNNTVREILIAREELSHRRNNRLIQTDGMALDLAQILPSNSSTFTVGISDELPTLNVKLGIGEDFGFSVGRRELMQFALVYFNGTPANDLRWYNSHGLQVSFVIRDDVGGLTATDLSIKNSPSWQNDCSHPTDNGFGYAQQDCSVHH